MPSVYTKYEGIRLTPEQEKSLTTIFTSVVEHALKSTKGLRGDWKPMGGFPVTSEGLTKSVLESYMFTMGCKNNKLYNKDEQGLVLNFNLNAVKSIYKSSIATECSHEETKWKKIDDSRTVYIDDLLDGKQIYYLQPGTTTKEYPNVAFYRKTDDGEYFVIAKPGIPLFIPLTIRQALEINKRNYTNMLEEQKKVAAVADAQFWIDAYTKQIALITDYLKSTPVKEIDKPCVTGNAAFLAAIFGNKNDISSIQSNLDYDEPGKYGMFVTLNPAYFNKTISKASPQFISIELRIQGNSAVALKAYNDFKANLDLSKLQTLLVK